MLCNTYTQIKITKQKNSKLVIIKFDLSVTALLSFKTLETAYLMTQCTSQKM